MGPIGRHPDDDPDKTTRALMGQIDVDGGHVLAVYEAAGERRVVRRGGGAVRRRSALVADVGGTRERLAAIIWRSFVEENVSPIMRVANASRAVAWYERLGFAKQAEHRFEPGLPAFVSITRGPVRIFLSEHKGDARPDTLIYLSIRNLDEVAAEFGVSIEEAPWGRELELRDPDANRIRVGSLD